MPREHKHGGKRKGAGRPTGTTTAPETVLVRATATARDELSAYARANDVTMIRALDVAVANLGRSTESPTRTK